MRGSPADLLAGFLSTAADELGAAVDDHLWGVDATMGDDVGVVLLAKREIGGRERVGPAEVIPVVDMLFESDDFDAVEGLVLAKFFEQRISGRTTGAALGSEKFDDDGLLRGSASL